MEAFPYLSPKDDYSLFNILCKQSSVEKNSPFLLYKNPPNLDLPSLDNINSHATRSSGAKSAFRPTSNAFRFQQLYASTHFPVSLLRWRDVRYSNHLLHNSSCNVNQVAPPDSDQTSAEQGKKRKNFEKIKEAEMKRRVSGKRSKVGDKRSSSQCPKKTDKLTTSEPPKDFIHVRARRGQATDSHSLAERVRREKINERMKILRELVPGCTKTTGKALMLEEIINYVKSLQNQVELLSMKVASVSACYDFSVEISKELSMEMKGAEEIPETVSHNRENSIEAQEASHVFGLSTSYDNMQEKPWTSLGEGIKLESMGPNDWDSEMQYLLDGSVHL
ncbi:hypothetical protein SUGI_0146290 [Cryptomeria japonica]|uniref:transcription factor BEE 1 n=1 Tax=Cryptomeria japonica TaxID=3369 RepID=UPI002408985E|nr:transcription factor BEE 1 [Cryptomeria japonica]GLJ11197.1 hypothetical protein SUGI_0146290 [Cryptomeria japonica]